MFQVRGERYCFVLPARQTNQRADAEPSKSRRVSALGTIKAKIEIALGASRVHLGIDTAIVSLLVNDETFGAGLDNRHVIFRFHRTHLDGDRRKIRGESAHAFSEII